MCVVVDKSISWALCMRGVGVRELMQKRISFHLPKTKNQRKENYFFRNPETRKQNQENELSKLMMNLIFDTAKIEENRQ